MFSILADLSNTEGIPNIDQRRRRFDSESDSIGDPDLWEFETQEIVIRSSNGGASKERLRSTPPLVRAAKAGDKEVMQLLLKTKKADVNEADVNGNGPLHWCLRKSSPASKDASMACLLLKHGASVSQKNRLGLTSVHLAAGSGNSQVLQMLMLMEPECTNMESKTGETPLFYAVKNDSMECADILLCHGAKTKVLNIRGQRAVDLARSQEMRSMLYKSSKYTPCNDGKENERIAIHEVPTEDDCSTERSFDDDNNVGNRSEPWKTVCRYHLSRRGCARGSKCYHAHVEKEIQPASHRSTRSSRLINPAHDPQNIHCKVFVGGLSPSVNSAELKDFMEEKFGPVENALVIEIQEGDRLRSRCFGFVVFKREETAEAAMNAHFISMSGKKVEVRGAVPKQKSSVEEQAQKLLPLKAHTEKEPIEAKAPGGEHYPLSSLKGDFRATCGLELNHGDLGYLKLSDFIRSLDDSMCQTKVVPVMGGPATHFVLLPHLPVLDPPTAQQELEMPVIESPKPSPDTEDIDIEKLLAEAFDGHFGRNACRFGAVGSDRPAEAYTNTMQCFHFAFSENFQYHMSLCNRGDWDQTPPRVFMQDKPFSYFNTEWNAYLFACPQCCPGDVPTNEQQRCYAEKEMVWPLTCRICRKHFWRPNTSFPPLGMLKKGLSL
ncbi:hypothetical protein QJS10_CPA03g01589 [Acorus calamus]|uniref:Uncharacterized protein n=1 Tax=Acorus calamus TaxID=4465 RepID=A0AAV9F2V7_ACOCL|nr:hypothetical protein QJS10_CPA03g01589 [Acorus calamus]